MIAPSRILAASAFQLRFQTELLEFAADVVADPVVLGGSDGMGHPRDLGDVSHGAFGGEVLRGRSRGNWDGSSVGRQRYAKPPGVGDKPRPARGGGGAGATACRARLRAGLAYLDRHLPCYFSGAVGVPVRSGFLRPCST